MQNDLKWIKKHFGEKMMHLCRENLYRLLENKGLVPKLLDEHFARDRHLAEDIVNQDMIDCFKSFMFSFVDVENNENVEDVKFLSAEQLLNKAGYVLFPECKSEEEIQVFTKYFAPGEALCTFNGGRLNTCRVWFAGKKNFLDLKRNDFKNPSRQDEYGTSLISIQFSKRNNALSIKNRYNHTVNNPDNTFNSDLDNIIPGLTDAFERDYGVRDSADKKNKFELNEYVVVQNKFYSYNQEINNIYYCKNNIIIDNFEIKKLPSHQMLIDYFIFDFKTNEVYLYDTNIEECFVESLGEIQSLNIENPNIIIKVKDGKDVVITINDKNQIIGLINENLTTCKANFLYKNKSLTQLSLPNLTTCDDNFLFANESLIQLSLPNLTTCGDCFLFRNNPLTLSYLPNLKVCGTDFLYKNESLIQLSLPNLITCGNSFLCHNNSLTQLDLPNLTTCGYSFLHDNSSLTQLNLPNLTTCGNSFLYGNNSLTQLSLPNLTTCWNGFLHHNNSLIQLSLPNLTTCNGYFLYKNNSLTKLSLPNLTTCGYNFLHDNNSLIQLSLPNLTTCGNSFLYQNNSLTKLDLPNLTTCGKCFLYSNETLSETITNEEEME